jgi:uncharacterized membrane protein YeaQ/YmgE (transglycosylase-associated protein family)
MTATIDAALGASEFAFFIHFLVFLVTGGAAGFLFASPRRWDASTCSLAIIGVCGAWLGAEFAHLFGWVESGGAYQLLAAAAGACGLVYAWRRAHRPAPDPDAVIAIHEPHA